MENYKSTTIGELNVRVPAAWQDHSILKFAAPDSEGAASNLVVTREARDGATVFEAFCADQADKLTTTLPRLERLRFEPFEHAAYRCMKLTTRWKDFEGRALTQHFYFLDLNLDVAVVTATSRPDSGPADEAVFDQVVRSLASTG